MENSSTRVKVNPDANIGRNPIILGIWLRIIVKVEHELQEKTSNKQ